MDARRLLERFTAHALGTPLTQQELDELQLLLSGRLSGRARRQARRHYDACPTRQHASRERDYRITT